MKTKRILILVLCLILLTALLVGCDKESETNYDINILCVDSVYSSAMVNAIKEKFAGNTVNVSYYAGPNDEAYIEALVKAGKGPDLIITTKQPSVDFQKDYLMNLSNYGFSLNYKNYLVNDLKVDNDIYVVPGSYSYTTIFYNKTLFDSNSWSVPTTESEFASLISDIKSKSIAPLAVSGGDNEVLFQLLSAYSQVEYFKSVDGKAWLNEYPSKDDAKSSEGFSTGFSLFYDIAQKNAFDYNCYNLNSEEAFDKLISGNAAMAFVSSDVASLEKLLANANGVSIKAMPIVGSVADNKVVPYRFNYFLAMNKNLQANDDKRAFVENVMSYLTSDEGLAKINTNECDVLPSKTSTANEWAVYDSIKTVVDNGYVAAQHNREFIDVIKTADDFLYNVCFNSYTSQPFTQMDTKHKEYVRSGNKIIIPVATDFTEQQTTQLMADIVYANANCDLALVSIGGEKNGIVNENGVNGHLLQGNLDSANFDMCLPGGGYGYVQIVYLSGAKIVEMINSGRAISNGSSSESFDYYWSGINITLDDYGKVFSIRFKDESAFERTEGQIYKVAILSNDYDSSFIPKNTTIASVGRYKTLFNSYLTEHINEIGSLSPSTESFIRK